MKGFGALFLCFCSSIAPLAVTAFVPTSRVISAKPVHVEVAAFVPTSRVISAKPVHVEVASTSAKMDNADVCEGTYAPISIDADDMITADNTCTRSIVTSIGGVATGLLASASAAFADYYIDGAEDDLEIESLPPPYVPIIFAIVIIGGVGVLTSSLGDVMYDEASLGMQSGAQAKKERERSRASYFKKK